MRDGVLNIDPWIDFMENPTEEFKAQVWDEHFTRDELRDLLHFAYRRFYWRPTFVVSNLFQIRNVSDLTRKYQSRFALIGELMAEFATLLFRGLTPTKSYNRVCP